MPPPAKVLEEPDVRLIVPVPVTVRFVDVLADHEVVPAIVQVPEPTAIVLVVETLVATVELDEVNETLYVAASNVPEINVVVAEEQVNASCNVTDPPGVSKLNPCVNVFPALVIV